MNLGDRMGSSNIQTMLNIIAPPTAILFLTLFLPPYYLFKSLQSIVVFLFHHHDNLHGKVVLITGASSGIGEHLAYEYARRGARLSLIARRAKRLQTVVAAAIHLGSPDAISIPADVSSLQDTKMFIAQTMSHFGRLDCIVINAGIGPAFMLEDVTDVKNMAPAMEINFWGAVYSAHTALPHLRSSKGRIVAVTSSAAWLSSPRLGMYSASKAAALSFFETLRIELKGEVEITIVTPGLTESELTKGKFLSKDGEVVLDQDLRDVQVNLLPVQPVERCAKAIVESACRGEKNLAVPSWMKQTVVWKAFFPELLDWLNRFLVLTSPGKPANAAAGKKILDFTGAKKILYPSSIQSPDLENVKSK